MYSSSIKYPLSKVHCLSKTKQNEKDMTNAAVIVNESYQSGAWQLIVTSCSDHGFAILPQTAK